ncbi:hypothetical protein BKA70DRAFT_1223058 [Coprinopsis sp. MPI-PUGE-AT-0042]|nr:hypothetical protein BKA70DRAFT_1223058 [Coprinopsis sp. MPI-PUGE-AT-0042]
MPEMPISHGWRSPSSKKVLPSGIVAEMDAVMVVKGLAIAENRMIEIGASCPISQNRAAFAHLPTGAHPLTPPSLSHLDPKSAIAICIRSYLYHPATKDANRSFALQVDQPFHAHHKLILSIMFWIDERVKLYGFVRESGGPALSFAKVGRRWSVRARESGSWCIRGQREQGPASESWICLWYGLMESERTGARRVLCEKAQKGDKDPASFSPSVPASVVWIYSRAFSGLWAIMKLKSLLAGYT